MKYALFIGCQIPARVSQYEMAVRMVLRDLDVDLVDERQFNCCGYLCTACPYCQIQFDMVQEMILSSNGGRAGIASILYPQLLGLSMGIDHEKLGINMNKIDISGIRSYLSEV